MYVPLVHADFKVEDGSEPFHSRGLTLVMISLQDDIPKARRQGKIVVPQDAVPFGGFAALFRPDIVGNARQGTDGDVLLVGAGEHGLQVARVRLCNMGKWDKFSFFDPPTRSWSTEPPSAQTAEEDQIYLSGSFTSGNIFFNQHFGTFILIYFNKWVDNRFYIRYLDLQRPSTDGPVWSVGGKMGSGIDGNDITAIIHYLWSPEQMLWEAPHGPGGYNYAGNAHPEYFNRSFFNPSMFSSHALQRRRRNDWFGSSIVSEADAGGDGRNLLLSWVSQDQKPGEGAFYQVHLARVKFGVCNEDTQSNESGRAQAERFLATRLWRRFQWC